MLSSQKNDHLTVAAVGLLAMCTVTFDHEALGHGGACLLSHGRILELSSSVFRCDRNSGLIDGAGPFTNALLGFAALLLRRTLPAHVLKLKLFLGAVTTFSFFWESGYLIQAALTRHGDMYFFAQWALAGIPDWLRWAAAALGVLLYFLSVRLATRTLLEFAFDRKSAKTLSLTIWLSGTIGATLAALAYGGAIKGGFRDAVLEIGLASIPLLFLPPSEPSDPGAASVATIARSIPLIVAGIVLYGIFVATLGRGFVG